MKRSTAADVAREAGVSRTTVSYVLNDTPHQQIPDVTKERVREAAARLRYNPSAAARALVLGRTDVVVFLLPAEVTLDDWSGLVLAHMSRRFAAEGLSLLTHSGRFGLERVDDLWRSITPAVVMCVTVDRREARAMRAAGVSHVMSLYGGDKRLHAIATQVEEEVVSLQLRTLLERGHEGLAYVSLEGAHQLTTAFRSLLLPQVAAGLGIAEPPHHVLTGDASTDATLVKALVADGVTGFCAVNDQVAGAVLTAARVAGLEVPVDLAVIGEGDAPLSAATHPALTTVHRDPDHFAEVLVDVVTRVVRQQGIPATIPPPQVSLVPRASV